MISEPVLMLICVCQVAALGAGNTNAGMQECIKARAHAAEAQSQRFDTRTPLVSLLKACHAPRQPPHGFPFLICNPMSSFLLFTHCLIPSTSQLAAARHTSLFVSQLRVPELQLSFYCCRSLELRLVHSSELPSSEALGLAQNKLPFSLWVSLAGGELPATDRLSCACVCMCAWLVC